MIEMSDKQLAVTQAIEGMTSMYELLAVFGTLAEKQLIDPMRVACWALGEA